MLWYLNRSDVDLLWFWLSSNSPGSSYTFHNLLNDIMNKMYNIGTLKVYYKYSTCILYNNIDFKKKKTNKIKSSKIHNIFHYGFGAITNIIQNYFSLISCRATAALMWPVPQWDNAFEHDFPRRLALCSGARHSSSVWPPLLFRRINYPSPLLVNYEFTFHFVIIPTPERYTFLTVWPVPYEILLLLPRYIVTVKVCGVTSNV